MNFQYTVKAYVKSTYKLIIFNILFWITFNFLQHLSPSAVQLRGHRNQLPCSALSISGNVAKPEKVWKFRSHQSLFVLSHLADWSPSCFWSSASFLLKNSVRTSSLLCTSPRSFTTSSLTCKSPKVNQLKMSLCVISSFNLSQCCCLLFCCCCFWLNFFQSGLDLGHLSKYHEV